MAVAGKKMETYAVGKEMIVKTTPSLEKSNCLSVLISSQ
jgi:hypothetical protein